MTAKPSNLLKRAVWYDFAISGAFHIKETYRKKMGKCVFQKRNNIRNERVAFCLLIRSPLNNHSIYACYSDNETIPKLITYNRWREKNSIDGKKNIN
jgi:hypothetical protein